jgi:hypothetical protein
MVKKLGLLDVENVRKFGGDSASEAASWKTVKEIRKMTLRSILGKSLYWWDMYTAGSLLCPLTSFGDICLNL